MSLVKGVKKKFKSSKSKAFKKSENLYRDWALSLLTLFVLIFSVAVFGAYTFSDVKNIEVNEDIEISDNVTNIINQELLIEVIDFYTEKEETYNKFKTDFRGAPKI